MRVVGPAAGDSREDHDRQENSAIKPGTARQMYKSICVTGCGNNFCAPNQRTTPPIAPKTTLQRIPKAEIHELEAMTSAMTRCAALFQDKETAPTFAADRNRTMATQ